MKYQENIFSHVSKNVPEILTTETAGPSMWLSKRVLVTFLIFLGSVNLNFIEGNINIAMVEMTSKKDTNQGNQTIIQSAEFNWESTTKALVLNVYAYGGLCSFLLSSLPSKLGGSRTYGSLMMLASILTMLTPFGLYLDFRCLLVVRFLVGFLENIAFSSTLDVFQHWIPLGERSRAMSFGQTGANFGAAILYSVCGFLAHKWGWSMVFYATGLCTFIWALIWLLLVPNDPSTDKRISKKELSYILAGTETTTSSTKISVPYKSIFASVPFWVVVISRIGLGWSIAAIHHCLPLFVKDATQKTTDLVGYISSVPSVICAISKPMIGVIMDYWKNNSNIKYTRMHKILLGSSYFVGGCLVAAAAFMSSFIVSITCFAIVRTLLTCCALVLLVVMVHLAPNHSGAVTALTTFWYSLGSILAQFFIGVITFHHTLEEWNLVFVLTSTVMIFSAISFVMFGSSEPQSWSRTSVESSNPIYSIESASEKKPDSKVNNLHSSCL